MKKIYLLAGVIILLVLISGLYKNIEMPSLFFSGEKTITADQAKDKALLFIKENLVQPGTVVGIKRVAEEYGMYKITLNVGEQSQDIDAYITKDGKKFFPQVMDIAKTEEDKKKTAEENAKPEDIAKTDKPTVDLYVMSFCPYGNQAEDTLKPVYDLLKNKVDFNFRYIVSSNGDTIQSLHGQPEVLQNEREACVTRDYGKDKWMEFVTYVNTNCGSDGACWETGAKSLGLSADKIAACVKSSGVTLMKNDEKVSKDAGASGSPTMIINGTQTKSVYQYGNSEAYKQAICGAFNNAPNECSTVLSSSTSTTQGGSCGN